VYATRWLLLLECTDIVLTYAYILYYILYYVPFIEGINWKIRDSSRGNKRMADISVPLV